MALPSEKDLAATGIACTESLMKFGRSDYKNI